MQDERKLDNECSKYKYKCKCGHTVVIYPFERKQKKICSWCGYYVYVSKKVEFVDRLKKLINKSFKIEGVVQCEMK